MSEVAEPYGLRGGDNAEAPLVSRPDEVAELYETGDGSRPDGVAGFDPEPDVMPVLDAEPVVRTVPDADPAIPPIPDTDPQTQSAPEEPDPLVHGLGSADVTGGDGQPRYLEASEPTDEPGVDFGLGSGNTQDTPPAPHPDEPDPLVHGLGSAEETLD